MHTAESIDPNQTKYTLYQQLCEQLHELIANETNFVANAANTCALLYESLPDVSWVGFYLAQGQELVVGPFQGKPACVRIPFGKGVCGKAAAEHKTIVVPNVKKFQGHIACDSRSQSEIVVPLLNWGSVLGVLDIDSTSLNRFDEEDAEGLESVVSVFLSSQSTTDLPDLSDAAAES